MRLKTSTLLLACIAAALGTAHAGIVNVSFVEPERFADAGEGQVERERNLKRLADHLRMLGAQRLPADQTLAIDVTEVDLAGEVRGASALHPRVLRGGADWPRIHLRWTLRSNDRTLRSGEDQLSDMNYLKRGGAPTHQEAFAFEKRLLDEWFSTRFASPVQ